MQFIHCFIQVVHEIKHHCFGSSSLGVTVNAAVASLVLMTETSRWKPPTDKTFPFLSFYVCAFECACPCTSSCCNGTVRPHFVNLTAWRCHSFNFVIALTNFLFIFLTISLKCRFFAPCSMLWIPDYLYSFAGSKSNYFCVWNEYGSWKVGKS